MSFAYQEEREYSRPSDERGKVANWIIWPSMLAIICGLLMGAGFGIVSKSILEFMIATMPLTNAFVFGCALFMSGLSGLTAVIFKSFSFDSSPSTGTTRKTPVMMTPQETIQSVNGNAALPIVSSNAHIVEVGGRKYNFTREQMNHLANRYFEEGTDYRVTRDDASGKKMFQDWAFAKIVMFDKGYWTEEKGGVYWSDEGGKWFESRMRMIHT